jgi:glutathione S-transferase
MSWISGPTASVGSDDRHTGAAVGVVGVGTSRTLRAHWALHELGLDYECRPILPRTGETQTREYTELNPRQKIPLLQDGDFKIAESPAIAAYLSDTYGTRENALIPTEPRQYATWLEWCFHAATELDATSLYVMRRHGALKHIYSEAPAAMESAAAYFAKQLRHSEQALRDGRAFLVGERLTTADMLLTTCLTWAVSYNVLITATCQAYMDRITARPTYGAALEANAPRTA